MRIIIEVDLDTESSIEREQSVLDGVRAGILPDIENTLADALSVPVSATVKAADAPTVLDGLVEVFIRDEVGGAGFGILDGLLTIYDDDGVPIGDMPVELAYGVLLQATKRREINKKR